MYNLPRLLRHGILTFGGILLLAGLLGCTSAESPESSQPQQTQQTQPVSPKSMDALSASIAEHGGLDRWRSFGTLEYDYRKGEMHEHHVVDLHSRKLLLTGEGYTIGFDGEEVWVMPDLEAYSGRPRFYSSLNFYFFGIPFVLADPGTIPESLGRSTFRDRPHDVMKVSFEPGIGDSPDDYYVAYSDTATHLVDLLLYTVTYRSQEPSDNYHARTYEWQDVDGLMVPSKMSSYKWNTEDETLGEHRYDAYFSNVTFKRERPDEGLFVTPEGAEIDPMPEVVTP